MKLVEKHQTPQEDVPGEIGSDENKSAMIIGLVAASALLVTTGVVIGAFVTWLVMRR